MQKNIKYVMLPILGLVITLVYFSLGWTTHISNLGGDSAGYLLAAQYFSPYQLTSAVVQDYSTQIIYPPLFPVTLALLGGGESILIAHEVVICFLLVAMFFLYRWAQAERLPLWLSVTLVLMFAFMPATYLISFNIWTENVYLLFSLMAATALSQDKISERMLILAAVAVSCAMLTRVAALPLAAAFLFYLVRHRPKRGLLLVSIAILPFALWAVVSALTERGAGAYLTHLEGKYSNNPVHFFIIQLVVESQALQRAWLDAWLGSDPTLIAAIIVNLFGVLGVVGWLVRLKDLRFDAVYVALYVAMLMIWPHPEEAQRYSYVLFPFLIIYACLVLSRVPAFKSNTQSYELATIGGVTLVFIAMLPTLMLNIGYYTEKTIEGYADSKHSAEWYVTDRRQAMWNTFYQITLLDHLASITEKVEDDDCIFAIKPTIVSLYSKRRSYGPPNSAKNDKDFWVEIGKCRYAYVLPFASPSYRDAFYPLGRLGKHTQLISEKRLTEDARSPLVGALYKIKD